MARQRLTRAESKARTRAELLRAAHRLFLRDGYADTSLAAIADEAALTKGAVYSNFESKEDLFLAVLEEESSGGARWYAPDDVSTSAGDDPAARAAAFGHYAGSQRPSRRQVALYLELNAAALRSDRLRKRVAEHNRGFFESFGARFAEALGVEVDDPARLGLIAQSLYAGLVLHGAFDGDADDATFAQAYEAIGRMAGAPSRAQGTRTKLPTEG